MYQNLKDILAGWQTYFMRHLRLPTQHHLKAQAVATVTAALALALASVGYAHSQPDPHADSGAAQLRQKHASLSAQLASNTYHRPLVIDSDEGASTVTGNAYAVLASPFATVSTTFTSPAKWCDVLILHLNTKYCRSNSNDGPSVLKVAIGRKLPQELKDAQELQFNYRVAASTPVYLAAALRADRGPVGTSDYRIDLQAIPLSEGKTFLHLRYSYSYGIASKLAMQAYLATVGSGKVGFTQLGQSEQAEANGPRDQSGQKGQNGQKPAYVGGVRGAVERNTIRYYLAIEAYLAALAKPDSQQVDARLEHWFNATEEYPLQLREVDRESYLSMKKQEIQRQQSPL